MHWFNRLILVLVLCLVFSAWVALTCSPARADTAVLLGEMHTSLTLTDRFVMHVPPGVNRLSIRVPVLSGSEQGGKTGLLGESMAESSVSVGSTVTPTSERDMTNAAGNTYRVLTFDHPASGDMVIQATFDGLQLSTDLNRPLPEVSLPVRDVPLSVAPFMSTSKLAESDNPQIQALAKSITSRALTEADATLAITEWMQRNIAYGLAGATLKTNALDTLRRREAACDGWAHLFIALSRASGIPARFVGGYAIAGTITYPLSNDGERNLLVSSDTVSHAWAEVWYPGAGWVPYDPQSSAGFADTHHVPIWTGVDADGGLPFLLWSSSHPRPTLFSIAEEVSAVDISDHMALEYLRSDVGTGVKTVLSRRAR